MITPLVSVIIVSYNTRDLTVKAINSVYASVGIPQKDIEVIVVDNNSSDDTVSYLKKNLTQVKVIANKKNAGFGAGNNQGAHLATGKYLLLLNTDAFLDSGTLADLVGILDKRSDLVAVGPKYRYADGSFQQSAGFFPSLWSVIGWMWWLDKLPLIKYLIASPYHLYDPKCYLQSRQLDWLMGACVLLRKDDFQKVSGFDEQIFMYGEEVELFIRLRQKTGKNAYYTNSSSITHLGSVSTKKDNASRLVYELKSIEYIYTKHYPHLLWFIRFILYTGVTMRIALFSLIPGRRDSVLEYKKFLNSR